MKNQQAKFDKSREEFRSMLQEHKDGDLAFDQFFLETYRCFCRNISAAETQNEGEKQALWQEMVTRNCWLVPVLPEKQRKEFLRDHLKGLPIVSDVSMADLAAAYNFSVPMVCKTARKLGISPARNTARAGREPGGAARRPYRIFNFARLMGMVPKSKEKNSKKAKGPAARRSDELLTVAEWKSRIVEVFAHFLPRPLPRLSTRKHDDSPDDIWRGVRYASSVCINPATNARTQNRYFALIDCKRFLCAWEEIEKVRWMRLPDFEGYVETDCLLNGPPLIFDIDEVLIPDKVLKSKRSRHPANAYLYRKAGSVKALKALGASNLRRATKTTEELEHLPPPFYKTQWEPTAEQWEEIFAQARATSEAN